MIQNNFYVGKPKTKLCFCLAAPYEFCDVGWVGKGDSCYWILEDVRTWFDGHEMCRHEGGELASVRSRVENDYVFSLLASLVTQGKNLFLILYLFTC